MTEEEAKQRWCPFARQAHFERDVDMKGIVAANRTEGEMPTTMCIGSACMAWRTIHEKYDLQGMPIPNGSGYCGLAGKP